MPNRSSVRLISCTYISSRRAPVNDRSRIESFAWQLNANHRFFRVCQTRYLSSDAGRHRFDRAYNWPVILATACPLSPPPFLHATSTWSLIIAESAQVVTSGSIQSLNFLRPCSPFPHLHSRSIKVTRQRLTPLLCDSCRNTFRLEFIDSKKPIAKFI